MSSFGYSIGDLIGDLGITGESALATARAYAAPTLANIHAVEAAFAKEGTSAPPELLNSLYERYYSAIQQNPAYGTGALQSQLSAMLPWILGGGVVLFLLMKRGR